MRTRNVILSALLFSAACAQGGPAGSDSSKGPAAVGLVTSGTVVARANVEVVGDLAYATTEEVIYTDAPLYRGFRITAAPGDHVDVWITSDDGDAVAWLLDSRMAVVAANDDASPDTLDAHLAVDIAAGADPVHYVVFRDYANADATFKVNLTGGPKMKICARDADCVRVASSCCAVGNNWDAVAAGEEAAHLAALACDPHQFCPTYVVADDDTQAECNQRTHLCEAVKPAAIACGGGMPNAHACPDAFACVGGPIDRPGHCAQECGAGLVCRADTACAANPDCETGEAGCLGICQ